MEKSTYKKPTLRVIALHQRQHLMAGSDPTNNPTTNQVNATREDYMGGVAWQWN